MHACREVRTRDKLQLRRLHLIEELIRADPTYRPPTDYRPAKKHKKVYIPQKDYPGMPQSSGHPLLEPPSSMFRAPSPPGIMHAHAFRRNSLVGTV